MENFIKLVGTVTAMLWPVLVAYALWEIIPPLRKTIESRTFSIKFSGFEISAQEATMQIEDQLKDLQDKVVELQNKLRDTGPPGLAPPGDGAPRPAQGEHGAVTGPDLVERRVDAPIKARQRILWVDDSPKNNALEISQLETRGYQIKLAQSTAEALELAQHERFDIIISDMGRKENNAYVKDAGLQLFRQLRAEGQDQPFIVYSSQNQALRIGKEIRALGGVGATSSTLELIGWIQLHSQT